MNKRISRLGVGLVLCYVLLFLQLNRIQVFQADELNHHPENFRQIQRDFDRPRGAIATADGVVVARSVETPGEPYERLRLYPEGELFAHITGFFSLEYGADGVELSYNDELAGLTARQQYDRFSDLFVDRDRTGDVFLTVRRDLQAVARQALGDRKGSIVLLEPRHGRHPRPVVAGPATTRTCSPPTTWAACADSRDFYLAEPDQPLLARTYRERFFPGSTFKVVTGVHRRRSPAWSRPASPSIRPRAATCRRPPPRRSELRRGHRAAVRCSPSWRSPATPPSRRWAPRRWGPT